MWEMTSGTSSIPSAETLNGCVWIIGALYVIAARIRDQGLANEAKRSVRITETKPVVERFFTRVNSSSGPHPEARRRNLILVEIR